MIPFDLAGQSSVSSGMIYGTEVSCSVSYPDNFQFSENSLGLGNSINISLSIEVTFNVKASQLLISQPFMQGYILPKIT
jgi:hypothetical protein